MFKMKRKIRLLHQIEITSRCNLKCKYCVHPKMTRAKVDMTWDVFKRCIELVKVSMREHGQNELNICGIGESTLHPQFLDFLAYARAQLGHGIVIVFSTNGIEIDDELAKKMAPFKPSVYVSMHRPEKAGPAVEALKKYGILRGVDANAAVSATNWAGQVEWFVSAPNNTCFWVPDGRVFVDAEGTIHGCCYDGNGVSNFGSVMDEDFFNKETTPYELCKTCHMNTNLY